MDGRSCVSGFKLFAGDRLHFRVVQNAAEREKEEKKKKLVTALDSQLEFDWTGCTCLNWMAIPNIRGYRHLVADYKSNGYFY